jgi:hypothetical protein
MSIGSLGAIGSFAAAPATQRTSDADKTQQATTEQSRADAAAEYAEKAAGIGETREESEADDRDADGRRLWERPDQRKEDETAPVSPEAPPAIDPTGTMGGQLDLTG